jgi:hypothetical protein
LYAILLKILNIQWAFVSIAGYRRAAFVRVSHRRVMSCRAWMNGAKAVLLAAWLLTAPPAIAVSPAASTTTLAVTAGGDPATTVAAGTVVTLTATIATGGNAVTVGTVKFCDATAAYCTDIHLLGTAQLKSGGMATILLRPGIGSHSYKATFMRTGGAASSASSAVTLAVTGSYPTITQIAQSGTVGNYTLTALVAGMSSAPPAGSVQLIDTRNSNNLLGTATLGGGASELSLFNVSNPPVSSETSSVAVGDLLANGILDLAVTNYNANILTVFKGNGDGTFTAQKSTSATGNGPIAVVAADFNGDGKLDLAVANYTDGTVTILLGNGDGTFATQGTVTVGTNPDAIAVGDFNGDGNLDLAVANYGSNSVTVLIGDGTGNFKAAAVSPATGSKPTSIIAGDFNNDGNLDLAVANYGSNSVTVLKGNGDGTFTALASPATGAEPNSIVAADFNGDGNLDLAVANFTGESVTILMGTGNGAFTAQASPATGNGPYSIAVADFNGDGIPDLATVNYDDNTVTVLVGSGNGTFTAAATTPKTGQYPVSVAAGDFNGVGAPDLAIANYHDTSLTVLETAGWELASAAVTNIAPVGLGTHLAVASYSGGGGYASSVSATTALTGQAATTTALAVTSRESSATVTTVLWGSAVTLTATVLVGSTPVTTGTVNFCDATATNCAGSHLLGTAQLTNPAGTTSICLTPGVGSHSYKAVFDGIRGGDGSAYSTVSASGVATLAVTGTTPTNTTIAQSGYPTDYTLTATVTGAGSTAPTGTVNFLDITNGNVLLGSAPLVAGAGGLSFLAMPNPYPYQNPYSTTTADFNGDGIPDLAVQGHGVNMAYFTIMLGNGDGTFTAQAKMPSYGGEPLVGDFNGDGIPDLAFMNGLNNTVNILLGDGKGNFNPVANSPSTGDFPYYAVVGDFNGDGKLDLAVTNWYSNTVSILLGNGDGTFTAAPSPATGLNPETIVAGDFNGDGILDLAVANQEENTITILLGNGDGTFTPAANVPTSGFPNNLVIGDFNGDGIPDLADIESIINAQGNDFFLRVLLGNGDGTFQSKLQDLGPGTFSYAMAVGDFNGDGIPDLGVTITGDNGSTTMPGTMEVLLGNGNGTFTDAASAATGVGPGFPVVADFNGDGVQDIAFSNTLTNSAVSNSVGVFLTHNQSGKATVPNITPGGTGTHLADAIYLGGGSYGISTSTTTALSTQLATVALGATATTITAGTQVTFPATVQGNATAGTPTGTVTFFYGTGKLATVPLNGSGAATYATGTLVAGQDSMTASYSGDVNYGSAISQAVVVTVTGTLAPSVTISPSASSITSLQSEILTIAVNGGAGNPTPTGAVRVTGGGYTSAATTLSSGSESIAISAGSLAIGGDQLTATYTPDTASAAYYATAAQATTVTVAAPPAPAQTTTTLAITSSGNPATTAVWPNAVTLTAILQAGNTPVATGQVNFCDATSQYCTDIHRIGTAQLTSAGTATFKFIPAIGSHSYKAVFIGTVQGSAPNAPSSSASAALVVTGTPVSVTSLTQSGETGNYTLSAMVTGTGNSAPTGTVSFLDVTSADALLGSAPLIASAPEVGFLNPSNPYVGPGVGSMAIGDINGDGIPDIVVPTAINGQYPLMVLQGNGDGTFTSNSYRSMSDVSPSFVAVADFNGDGIPDIAIVNQNQDGSGYVAIILGNKNRSFGNGDGTFTTMPSTSSTGIHPSSIAVGDFNGDGIPDLVITSQGEDSNNWTGTVTILLGNGDGTFTPAPVALTGSSYPTDIIVGDFNGDGKADLAVADWLNSSLSILLGNGDGTFTTAASPATGNSPRSIAAGDFLGNGKLDLAVTNYGDNSVSILLGNGDGTFKNFATIQNIGTQPDAIAIGDFNGDGIPDLAVTSLDDNATAANPNNSPVPGTVTILLGHGDGTFTVSPVTPQTGNSPNFIAVGDFNGDGVTDIVTANNMSDTATVLITQTQSATATATGVSPVGTGTHQVDASYPGDSDYASGTSASAGLTAQLPTPRMALAANPSDAVAGTPVTITATINGTTTSPSAPSLRVRAMAATPTPTGTVTFFNGNTQLGSSALNSSGVASYTTSSLALGQDSITGSYSGDAHYSPVTSSPVVVSVSSTAPAPVIGSMTPTFTSASGAVFTITVNGSAFMANSTVNWGATALATTYVGPTQLTAQVTAAEITSEGITAITVVTPAPGGGASAGLQFEVDSADSATTPPSFTASTAIVTSGSPANYSVTLPATVSSATVSCLNLPTGATCSYSAGTITIATSSATPAGTYLVTVIFTETVTGAATAGILFPFLLLPLVMLRRRMARRGIWITACMGLVVMATVATICIGCGGGGPSSVSTPPPTHQVTSSGAVSLTIK